MLPNRVWNSRSKARRAGNAVVTAGLTRSGQPGGALGCLCTLPACELQQHPSIADEWFEGFCAGFAAVPRRITGCCQSVLQGQDSAMCDP